MFTTPAVDMVGRGCSAGSGSARGARGCAGCRSSAASCRCRCSPRRSRRRARGRSARWSRSPATRCRRRRPGSASTRPSPGSTSWSSVDLYVNETTRHADVILPPTGPLERDHYDLIFHLFAVRNTARWARALFERPDGGPPRLGDLPGSRPGPGSAARSRSRPSARPSGGPWTRLGCDPAVAAGRRAARIRPDAGPVGRDAAGDAGRRRSGPAAAAAPAAPRHGVQRIDLAPRSSSTGWRAPGLSCRGRRPPARWPRPAAHRATPPARQQLVDAQPGTARQGQAAPPAAGQPSRPSGAGDRVGGSGAGRLGQRRAGGRVPGQRRHDARRGEPAPRIRPCPPGSADGVARACPGPA